jgi:hypothetical protein
MPTVTLLQLWRHNTGSTLTLHDDSLPMLDELSLSVWVEAQFPGWEVCAGMLSDGVRF